MATVGERFNDFTTYSEMTYSKAQLFYEQLRYVVGDESMVRILRTYFDRWKLKHVDEAAFRGWRRRCRARISGGSSRSGSTARSSSTTGSRA